MTIYVLSKRLTVLDTAIGFKATPPQAHALQAQIKHLKCACSKLGIMHEFYQILYIIFSINPAKCAPASFMLNTYYTQATNTLLTIMEGAVATQSLNFYKQYIVAANFCSTSNVNFYILIVLTQPTSTSWGFSPSLGTSSWYSMPP